MTDETITVTFKVPDKKTPGFAKRMKKALYFASAIKAKEVSPDLMDQLVVFLADFVVAETKEQAIDWLWDADEDQFMDCLTAVSGGTANAVPPEKSES